MINFWLDEIVRIKHLLFSHSINYSEAAIFSDGCYEFSVWREYKIYSISQRRYLGHESRVSAHLRYFFGTLSSD